MAFTILLSEKDRLKEMEQVTEALGFVFSRNGFTQDALDVFREHQIAWSEDERWIE